MRFVNEKKVKKWKPGIIRYRRRHRVWLRIDTGTLCDSVEKKEKD